MNALRHLKQGEVNGISYHVQPIGMDEFNIFTKNKDGVCHDFKVTGEFLDENDIENVVQYISNDTIWAFCHNQALKNRKNLPK